MVIGIPGATPEELKQFQDRHPNDEIIALPSDPFEGGGWEIGRVEYVLLPTRVIRELKLQVMVTYP